MSKQLQLKFFKWTMHFLHFQRKVSLQISCWLCPYIWPSNCSMSDPTSSLTWIAYVSQAGSTEATVPVSVSVQQALVSKCDMSGWGCTSLSLPDRKTTFYQPYFFPSMVPEFTVMNSTEAHNVWCFFKLVLRYSEGRILHVKIWLFQ